MNEYLINKLKEGRLAKGLKQSDVTRLTGIKNTTLSNYENGVTEPDIDTFLQLCDLYELDYAGILGEAYGLNVQGTDFDIKPSEIEYIKKYRFISKNLPSGTETVDFILEHEYKEAIELKKRFNELAEKTARIAELEATNAAPSISDGSVSAIIDISPHLEANGRMLGYYYSASAGEGVFMMGDEGFDNVVIPEDTPGADKADYLIKISGNSMEPDFHDGEVALVARLEPVKIGDVGIFIVNGNAYIKEYGKTELISRNPDANNIKISEHANIVCMGKVVGKIREESITRV